MNSSSNTKDLLGGAERALALAPAYLDPWVRQHAGARLAELEHFYALKNGFLAFNRALRVFPAMASAHPLNLNRWNEPGLWRGYYGELAEGLLFFADDVFGGQFCIKENNVFGFDPETGDLEWLADDLEGWAAVVVADSDHRTGQPLALDWQEKHGPLDPEQRLVPTLLFALGGEFSIDNLTATDAVAGMRIRGPIAQRIHGLPDGAQIQFEIMS